MVILNGALSGYRFVGSMNAGGTNKVTSNDYLFFFEPFVASEFGLFDASYFGDSKG